ncbi:MAG TPA: signal peptide peptidase SppA, partial [Ochrobactrum sp.]|nr:signal peptide peptidase SppA [Ochrobactrum sp.]
EEAVAWLAGKGLSKDLPRLEWKPVNDDTGFSLRDLIIHAGARLIGVPQEADGMLKQIAKERIFLDGLLSVWHVDGTPEAN